MRRRYFIALLAGSVAAWSKVVHGQSVDRVQRIGILAPYDANDPQGQARIAAFRGGLQELGWTEGRNVTFDYRYAPAASIDRVHTLAKDLVALSPGVILAISPPMITAAQKATREIPIVFIGISDPIGGGFAASLARPGGNITGLLNYEPGITGKWLSMLKEIAPRLGRVAFIGNPQTTAYDYYFQSAQAATRALALELVPIRITNKLEIERGIEVLAKAPDGGLVVLPDSTAILHRDVIIALANKHRLPAVFPFRFFVTGGGLMSYGTVDEDQFRQVASHIDRVLRGANPAELPVQTPTKYETVINMKAATVLGLTFPSALLVAADEVIE